MKNKIKQAETDVLNDLYNIILNNHINGYERDILLSAKNELEYEQNYTKTLMKLQTELNGFAINSKLSPEVSSFYKQLPEYLLRIAPTNFTGIYRPFSSNFTVI